MRNKFRNIVKVKKTALNKCENEIAHLNYEKDVLSKKQYKTNEMINLFVLPNSGSFIELQSANTKLSSIRMQMQKIVNDIKATDNKIENKQNEYKYHNIEYEKIKYLEKDEQKKIDEKIKKQEENAINDVTSYMHYMKSS
jgi:hypothetical protein